jgi:hypothetical protein
VEDRISGLNDKIKEKTEEILYKRHKSFKKKYTRTL